MLAKFFLQGRRIKPLMKVSELRTALDQIVTDGAPHLERKRARLTRLCDTYFQNYGDGDVSLLRAPARINVLGEHIDYVSYVPTASVTFGSRERDALLLFGKSALPLVRGSSTSQGYNSASFPVGVPSPRFGEDNVADWLAFLTEYGTPNPAWHNYIRGAIVFACGKYGHDIVKGFDFVVDSNIPAGGGASSSSALVVLGGAAIRNVNEISFTPAELAHDSALAEWFIGTRGGSMDHTTICLARPSSAVLINYDSHKTKRIGIPDQDFQWLTFFTQPANKGREVMLEYNERAAVSRLIIPAIISKWQESNPELLKSWRNFLTDIRSGNIEAISTGEQILERLPEFMSIESLRTGYPELYLELQRSFIALLDAKDHWPISVRNRAQHHLGEVRRVALAEKTLMSIQNQSTADSRSDAMRTIGKLIDESHASLRDLYGVSTDEVEQLIKTIQADANVLGARLMGGGFGGNVLALTTRVHSKELIDRVQERYYGPRSRDGVAEGAVMISTPGEGLSPVSLDDLWREFIVHMNSLGPAAASSVNNLRSLLEVLPVNLTPTKIWPVIVAAGKGKRAAESGLEGPKPLALVGHKPAILHVLDNIEAGLGPTQVPVVIVSPETEKQCREQLQDRDVVFVTQRESVGTGDAVWRAKEVMKDFDGLSLVVWSTQPVIRASTFKLTAKLSGLFNDHEMIVPTTFRQNPYAPINRNRFGEVQSARETHLESAQSIEFGETNIGLFLLKNRTMFELLEDLRNRHWSEANRCYDRPRGELGFPNELISALAQRPNGVLASPIADSREEQGIKQVTDIAKCELFISELARIDAQTTG